MSLTVLLLFYLEEKKSDSSAGEQTRDLSIKLRVLYHISVQLLKLQTINIQPFELFMSHVWRVQDLDIHILIDHVDKYDLTIINQGHLGKLREFAC